MPILAGGTQTAMQARNCKQLSLNLAARKVNLRNVTGTGTSKDAWVSHRFATFVQFIP